MYGTAIAPATAEKLRQSLAPVRGGIAGLLNSTATTWKIARSASLDAASKFGAPLLAERILMWREQALQDGTQPMSDAIRSQLVGYFPKTLLDSVRYRIGWNRTMHAGLFRLINVRALALFDVIVFRDEVVAGDPVIWAHELAHVRQFGEWGTLEFARRYLREADAVEFEAWECAARYTMWALEAASVSLYRQRSGYDRCLEGAAEPFGPEDAIR